MKRVQLRDNQLPWISQKQICTVYVIDFRPSTNLSWVNNKKQRNKVTASKRNAVKDICIDAASTTSLLGRILEKDETASSKQ